MFKLNQLHDRYGPVIRCSPGEIHIRDSSFLDTLHHLLRGGPFDFQLILSLVSCCEKPRMQIKLISLHVPPGKAKIMFSFASIMFVLHELFFIPKTPSPVEPAAPCCRSRE